MSIEFFDAPHQVGIASDMLIHLDHARDQGHISPALLPYLDLIENSELELPDAVIQVDGRAVMYLVKPQALGGDRTTPTRLSNLVRVLACRGDARFLGIAEPGRLTIYPIGIYEECPLQLGEISVRPGNTELHDFLSGQSSLKAQSGAAVSMTASNIWLDSFLFDLLTKTAEQLKSTCSSLSDSEILSLIGRCLFVRFIADRKIICDSDASLIAPTAKTLEDLLATPESSANTFKWLDTTFNGNILPLFDSNNSNLNYQVFFEGLETSAESISNILNNIMRRAPGGQLQLFWEGILFQHVPADMLSQVYEHFAHAYQSKHAKSTSIHYTPRHIAQQLVDAAFAGITTADKDKLKVLDPASGAGVFLVLAFKRLVQENWKRTGTRPNRSTIRKILNEQVYGLDINPESLKFSALSLYLTALELDPEPTPLDDLRFDRLADNTLIYVGENSELFTGASDLIDTKLGSLSEYLKLPKGLEGEFDLVIGNPPWTEFGSTYKSRLDQQAKRIATGRKINSNLVSQLKIDNGVPDIAFIWKALEWAKPGGMIAYALHAQHLLFRQGNGAVMRKALFQCLEITGVLNGSALRNEKKIWPNITAPFCFLVARNRKPNIESSFYYLSPSREKQLNDQALFRIDPQSAVSVTQTYAVHLPWLFKTLARGSGLDLEVTSKIAGIDLAGLTENESHIRSEPSTLAGQEKSEKSREKLSDYWTAHSLKNHDGVQNASAKTAKSSSEFHGLPYLTKHVSNEHVVKTELLPFFELDNLYRSYEREIFASPIVLFRESPKKQRSHRGAIVAFEDLIYRETFFGYSCAGHPTPELLAKYIQLISLSEIFTYWTLMTSSKYGIERDAILKEDVDAFPIVPLERLSGAQSEEIFRMSEALHNDVLEWDSLDKFMGKIYGLNRADQSVIRDTLAVGLPYPNNKDYAESTPTEELESFNIECSRILKPFAERAGKTLVVHSENHEISGWRFVRFELVSGNAGAHKNMQINLATDLANHFWASQIRLHESPNSLIIGQVAQNRYWTKTRARSLALDLLGSNFIQYDNEKYSQGATG
ncbi:HsdM family class I SAM-dependent methyltransferase [Pseudomonas koreensis]|uniref:HsdM family class I SAM-dependent methyltransferase n=1 Tax=Pseudomonas koreensis TaxID=198620 RepID=UPI00138669EF|nr:N-6 DNA methylase [Pseudomonas koreensis]